MSTILSTQGVQVYILDDRVSPDVALEIDLLRDFNGLGGPAKKIDTTTFSNTNTESYIKGLIAPAETTGTLIFAADSSAHQYLIELEKRTGTSANVQIFVGESDGTSPPTVVAGVLTPPSSGTPADWTRSGFWTKCYVSKVQLKHATNDVVMADLSIQPLDELKMYTKGEATTIVH